MLLSHILRRFQVRVCICVTCTATFLYTVVTRDCMYFEHYITCATVLYTLSCLSTCDVLTQVKLVEGQVVRKEFGLVTKPVDEIWITLERRK